MSKLRVAGPCNVDSIVDGPGLRIVIWTQGCRHHCLNCHNPQTHDYQAGQEIDTQEIIELIDHSCLQSGITLSGGEPFDQACALVEVAQHAKQKKLNVWAYSGYTWEEIIQDEAKKALLKEVDVLVDGRFIDAQRHYQIKFKGSLNQRIIDVKASLLADEVILSKYDEDNLKITL